MRRLDWTAARGAVRCAAPVVACRARVARADVRDRVDDGSGGGFNRVPAVVEWDVDVARITAPAARSAARSDPAENEVSLT